jgi:hypothetical protein
VSGNEVRRVLITDQGEVRSWGARLTYVLRRTSWMLPALRLGTVPRAS